MVTKRIAVYVGCSGQYPKLFNPLFVPFCSGDSFVFIIYTLLYFHYVL